MSGIIPQGVSSRKPDGLEVCRRLRRDPDPAVSGVPIIMLTASVEEADRLNGFGTGADDYVTKPFQSQGTGERVPRRSSGGWPAGFFVCPLSRSVSLTSPLLGPDGHTK